VKIEEIKKKSINIRRGRGKMRRFCLGSGKIIVMHLKRGDLVKETITEQFREMGIKNAVLVSGIGSCRKMTIHYVTQNPDAVDEFLNIEDDAVEIGCMQGMIIEGEPHIHLACSAHSAGKCYMAHLENGCEVMVLMELAFLVMDDEISLQRKKYENGDPYICLK